MVHFQIPAACVKQMMLSGFFDGLKADRLISMGDLLCVTGSVLLNRPVLMKFPVRDNGPLNEFLLW